MNSSTTALHFVSCLVTLLPLACSAASSSTDTPAPSDSDSIWSRPSSVLDPKALPLGDGKFTADGPKKGWVYACDPNMYRFTTVVGAAVTGPWVDQANKTFDPTAKVFVHGSATWDGKLDVSVSAGKRVFVGNGLPIGITTGTFPVTSDDPAYEYDPNPNAITAQSISFSLPQSPTVDASAHCTYKRIGITLDGVEIDAPLDSSGRDENGYELADACGGKPQPGGSYHRQYLSDCVPHIKENSALVGYALDGFGIYSPFDDNGNELTSADLDECHGITSEITWDGQRVNMYHYVMTRDFPYTLTCFRGTPNYDAFPALPKMSGMGGDGGAPPKGSM
jgi:hypothetical protein